MRVARVERKRNPGGPSTVLPSPGFALLNPGYGSLRAVATMTATLLLTATALAGPVLVYREGAYCPQDRPATAPRITAAQAIERGKALLPADFCGPTWYVSGCDFDPEWAFDTWRVFARQYKLVNGEKEYQGRDHSYVVLDAVGNCLANIPGT